MEALACNICKEPAWNFMCMDCVAKGIKKVLPKKLERGFQRFHESFYSHFDSPQLIMNGAVYCMNCKSTKENPVCPNCYAKEVAQWLGERSTRAAGKVMGSLCLPFWFQRQSLIQKRRQASVMSAGSTQKG